MPWELKLDVGGLVRGDWRGSWPGRMGVCEAAGREGVSGYQPTPDTAAHEDRRGRCGGHGGRDLEKGEGKKHGISWAKKMKFPKI